MTQYDNYSTGHHQYNMSELKRGDRNLSKYKKKNALLFYFCETRSQRGGVADEKCSQAEVHRTNKNLYKTRN